MAAKRTTVKERLSETTESMMTEAFSKLDKIEGLRTYADFAKDLFKYAEHLSEIKTGLLMIIENIEGFIESEAEHTDYGPYDLKDTVQRRVDEETRKRRGK